LGSFLRKKGPEGKRNAGGELSTEVLGRGEEEYGDIAIMSLEE